MRWLRWTSVVVLGAAVACAVAQLGLLGYVFFARLNYPLDVEWMESGMLAHAWRVMNGLSVYSTPSADFIAYAYTPLYPYLLGALGKIFGLSYTLGRLVSILSFALANVVVVLVVLRECSSRWIGRSAAVVAVGLVAATFPHTSAWFDLVRNDSLMLGLSALALYLLCYKHQSWPHLIAAGALLAGAFLTKQTASMFVLAAGLAMLVLNWRRAPALAAVVGVLAGGWLVVGNTLSAGWMWTYIYKVHQGHTISWENAFVRAPKLMFAAAPVALSICALWPIFAVLHRVLTRHRQRCQVSMLYWFFFLLVAMGVACLGYGMQWAVENAFIPGLTLAAMFSALAVNDVVLRLGLDRRAGQIALVLLFAALAAQLANSWYSVDSHVPTAKNRVAAEQFLRRLAALEGPILMPYHPYYPQLVGKPEQSYHQMAFNNAQRAGLPAPAQLSERIAKMHYGSIVLDTAPGQRYQYFLNSYKFEHYFRGNESPPVFTGYRVRPLYLLVPKRKASPQGSVFDFEDGSYDGWQREGTAFGSRPLGGARSDQGLLGPYSGRYVASTIHVGDGPTGKLISPPFRVIGRRLSYRIGGGRRPDIYVRFLVDGKEVHRQDGATHNHIMERREVDVSAHLGKQMVVEVVDNARRPPMGFIAFDDLRWVAE
ncbi:MAG: glycosyltransferase family 39 protein [Deltaproteobacteria bacterium]|nr:glycosyltransferase family 39 protein [Deltaproteobacteria bacterium]